MALVDEYRDGNVPAGMSNLPLIKRGFAALPTSVEKRYFRADSACYEEPVLKWFTDEGREGGPQGPIGFAISADMSKELQEVCKAADVKWESFEDRWDETLEWAEVEFTPGDWPKDPQPLRYVALKIRKKQTTTLRLRRRYQVPRGGDEPRGRDERRRCDPMASQEGWNHRADARRHKE